MPIPILDGLSLVDSIGRIILATTALVLARRRRRPRVSPRPLRGAGARLRQNAGAKPALLPPGPQSHRSGDAEEAARRSGERNTQAIIEENFQAELGSLLLAERFVRAATGLVIILGLLGTFYGLTLSIGKLVHSCPPTPAPWPTSRRPSPMG